MYDGKLANQVAIAVKMLATCIGPDLAAIPDGPCEPHRPDGLFLAATVRAGHSADSNGDIGTAQVQRTVGHLLDNGLAHRAMLFDNRVLHTEYLFFRAVRITHDAVLKYGRGTANIGNGLGDPATRAGLGRGNCFAGLVDSWSAIQYGFIECDVLIRHRIDRELILHPLLTGGTHLPSAIFIFDQRLESTGECVNILSRRK